MTRPSGQPRPICGGRLLSRGEWAGLKIEDSFLGPFASEDERKPTILGVACFEKRPCRDVDTQEKRGTAPIVTGLGRSDGQSVLGTIDGGKWDCRYGFEGRFPHSDLCIRSPGLSASR